MTQDKIVSDFILLKSFFAAPSILKIRSRNWGGGAIWAIGLVQAAHTHQHHQTTAALSRICHL
jgi:hypothetical protein